MMNYAEAKRLLALVVDQLEEDTANAASATLRELGNGEPVVIISTPQSTFFLWSHDDWKALRRRLKAKAEQKRKLEHARHR